MPTTSEILFEQKINGEQEAKAKANLDQFLILVHDVLYLEIRDAMSCRSSNASGSHSATAHLTCFNRGCPHESFTGSYFPLVAWVTYRLQQHSKHSFMIGITIGEHHWSLHWTGSRGIAYREIDNREVACVQGPGAEVNTYDSSESCASRSESTHLPGCVPYVER